MLTSIRLVRVGLDERAGNGGRGWKEGTKAFRRSTREFRKEEGGRASVAFGARGFRSMAREDDGEA